MGHANSVQLRQICLEIEELAHSSTSFCVSVPEYFPNSGRLKDGGPQERALAHTGYASPA